MNAVLGRGSVDCDVGAFFRSAENVLERKDLQRLLRQNCTAIGTDLLVIAEEYGEWEDSGRRIDLLCLNKAGDCVVVEIKRTESGGHMELQAIRYAAMVSSMTLDQAIAAYAKATRRSMTARGHSSPTMCSPGCRKRSSKLGKR